MVHLRLSSVYLIFYNSIESASLGNLARLYRNNRRKKRRTQDFRKSKDPGHLVACQVKPLQQYSTIQTENY